MALAAQKACCYDRVEFWSDACNLRFRHAECQPVIGKRRLQQQNRKLAAALPPKIVGLLQNSTAGAALFRTCCSLLGAQAVLRGTKAALHQQKTNSNLAPVFIDFGPDPYTLCRQASFRSFSSYGSTVLWIWMSSADLFEIGIVLLLADEAGEDADNVADAAIQVDGVSRTLPFVTSQSICKLHCLHHSPFSTTDNAPAF